MKKIRFFLLITRVFLKRYYSQIFLSRRAILVTSFITAVIFFILNFKLFFVSPGVVSEGMVGIYSQHNLPSQVTNLISEPLIFIDKNGRPQPNLLVGWQTNNDASIYTFRLKDQLYWSDGTKVRVQDIEIPSIKLNNAKITYPDDQSIQIQLDESLATLPSLLSVPVFKRGTLVGVGHYKVSGFQDIHGIYTKMELVPVIRDLPKVTIRFYPDEKTAKLAYNIGEVESLVGVNDDKEYKDSAASRIRYIQTYNRLIAIFYNMKDPSLSDKNLRKALSLATVLPEGEDRAHTSIAPNSWVFNDSLKDNLNSPDQVKEFLSKTNNDKGNVVTLTTTPGLASLGESIISSWKKQGIVAVLRIESGNPQNFQALLFPLTIPADPDQYSLWHSSQAQTNLSHYSSPRVDRDLEDGRKNANLTQRKERYLDMQRVINDDLPATFLYFQKTDVIYRKKAENNLNKILPLQFPSL